MRYEVINQGNAQHSYGHCRHRVAVQRVGAGQSWLLIPAPSLMSCATWANNLTSLSLRSLLCKMRTTASILSTLLSCCKD